AGGDDAPRAPGPGGGRARGPRPRRPAGGRHALGHVRPHGRATRRAPRPLPGRGRAAGPRDGPGLGPRRRGDADLVRRAYAGGMRTRARRTLVLVGGLLLAGCHGESVPNGTWGGDHVVLTVTDGGGTVEMDCAHGTLDHPLQLDDAGRFSVAG